MNVVVNGGTGWLGIAALRALKRLKNTEEVKIFSSDGRLFHTHDLGSFKTYNLKKEIDIELKSDIFINLAFKTRDYIAQLGEEEYSKINLEIINSSINLARNLKPKSIIIISSGIVARYNQSGGKLDNTEYTHLKIYEEKLFSELSRELDCNLVILRMWGGSGRDFIHPLKYAIGDLIMQGLRSDKLVVNSTNLVFRRYSDASQQMEIALRCAMAGMNTLFDSGGVVVEMEELANLIKNIINPSSEVIRNVDLDLEPDIYYSQNSDFENLARNFNVDLYDMKKQIEETKISVLRAI
jgi:nucleoside-diphosphate-sugar epimerase